jgi:hypothetical protein
MIDNEITKIIDGQKIEYDLRFERPFRETNQGYFSTETVSGNQTQVKWAMTGKSSFPLSVLSLFMDCDKMIGCQFEAGLSDLKTILENK